MKATNDPYKIADLAWADTHSGNFGLMADRIMTEIAQLEPPVTDSQSFLARVMELSWKTGFACGLEFMATGAVKTLPPNAGNN